MPAVKVVTEVPEESVAWMSVAEASAATEVRAVREGKAGMEDEAVMAALAAPSWS